MWKNKAAATTAAALALLLAAAPALPVSAVTEQEAKSYEQQAQQKKQKSDEIQGRINNFSEEKRQLDAALRSGNIEDAYAIGTKAVAKLVGLDGLDAIQRGIETLIAWRKAQVSPG